VFVKTLENEHYVKSLTLWCQRAFRYVKYATQEGNLWFFAMLFLLWFFFFLPKFLFLRISFLFFNHQGRSDTRVVGIMYGLESGAGPPCLTPEA